jgi:large conductance mechanosensitive channel
MISELKNFLLRGDVITLAVAVIIGEAFGKIVTAFSDGIIKPLLGMIAGSPEVALKVGPFDIGLLLTAIIGFIVTGTVLFFVIKAAGKKSEEVK